MKPRPQPTYNLVRQSRAEAALTGAGVTLLVVGVALLAILLVVVAKWYQVLQQAQQFLGPGLEEFGTLTFLAQTGGAVFFGVLVATVVFGLLLSRAPRPGVALTIQGVALLIFVMVLVLLVVAESQEIIATLMRAFSGLTKMPMHMP